MMHLLKTVPNDYYQKGIDAGIEWAKWFYDLTAPQIPALMKDYIHNPAYAPGAPWTDADVQNYLDYKKIKDEEITAFKASPMYTLSGSPDEQLEMIINQKIVALFPDEFQGWCEYRRTGYPKVPIGPDQAALQGKVPRREPWPTRRRPLTAKVLMMHYHAMERIQGLQNSGGMPTPLHLIFMCG
ncbi:MAG: SusD/RagB family nutrient-binding outer membrane lipoprotein [Bacteroidales bacterium]|nr:SusD/RagB family nutrient-binding outer membrane lipoprotein [Bacteroidales bacterium]